MSKNKSEIDLKKATEAKGADPKSTASFGQTIRETIESIVIAFVLAFMFKTFEAEAFVIPTGSMANTLKGRHKDLLCTECGFRYQVSASDEVESETGKLQPPELFSVVSGLCPNCRFTEKKAGEQTSYNGDRILVAKFPFEFFAESLGEPKRWEVVVFKYPLNANQNYIKRLIGLPGEKIRIHHGDIWIDSNGGNDFHLERKPPNKVLAMKQMVYDNDRHSAKWDAALEAAKFSPRWQGEPLDDSLRESVWKTDDGSKSFHTTGKAETPIWLRYRHRVPSFDDWTAVETGTGLKNNIAPQLISDMYAYNSEKINFRAVQVGTKAPEPEAQGMHWVGDLIIECDLTVEQATGAAVLELISGGRKFQCRLNLEKSSAELSIDGGKLPFDAKRGRNNSAAEKALEEETLEEASLGGRIAKTNVSGTGTYHVTFANVDQQLHLWINGSLVEFDGPTTYALAEDATPTVADLSPVGISSEGAGLKVSGLKLSRDVYYLATEGGMKVDYQTGPFMNEFIPRHSASDGRSRDSYRPLAFDLGEKKQFEINNNLRTAFFSQPQGNEKNRPENFVRWDWDQDFKQMRAVFFSLKKDAEHPELDQFFMMGDNSPASADGRLWGRDVHFVPRHLLVGKALFIYWPHSFNEVFSTGIPFPFFPNFSRMGFVR